MERHPRVSFAAISTGFAAYFALLVSEVRAFEGSFRESGFCTAPAVIPWCVYVMAGFFAAPFLVQCLVSRASTEPKGNGPAVLTMLLVAVWTLLPYLVLQYATFYERITVP
jgi:hypothetical protein